MQNYFGKFCNENSTPWFSHKNFDREFISTVNRIRANHYNLEASSVLFAILNADVADELEDLDHIPWQ